MLCERVPVTLRVPVALGELPCVGDTLGVPVRVSPDETLGVPLEVLLIVRLWVRLGELEAVGVMDPVNEELGVVAPVPDTLGVVVQLGDEEMVVDGDLVGDKDDICVGDTVGDSPDESDGD